MQDLLDHTSEARRLRHSRTHLREQFPYLPQQSGYNKRLRILTARTPTGTCKSSVDRPAARRREATVRGAHVTGHSVDARLTAWGHAHSAIARRGAVVIVRVPGVPVIGDRGEAARDPVPQRGGPPHSGVVSARSSHPSEDSVGSTWGS